MDTVMAMAMDMDMDMAKKRRRNGGRYFKNLELHELIIDLNHDIHD